VTSPVWTVQAYQSTRAVADGEDSKPPSAIQAVKEIVKQDGVRGLWRGLGPALILVINPVIQVCICLCCVRASCGTVSAGADGT